MPFRVLVADDHSMVRQGLQMFFDDDPEITIVGEARNGEEALEMARELRADVVLMDLLMPGVDGVAATQALRHILPHVHVVAMTSVVEESGVQRAIEAGAIGYVLKDTRPDELREALLAAAHGRVRFAPESAGRLMRDVATPEVDPETLSTDERELLLFTEPGTFDGGDRRGDDRGTWPDRGTPGGPHATPRARGSGAGRTVCDPAGTCSRKPAALFDVVAVGRAL